jgi:anti-anti-sigma regulatory factor
MPEATFTVEQTTPHRFLVWLRGSLDDEVIDALSDELLPRLRKVGAKGELIIDFVGAESCTTAARLSLIDLQREIAVCSARTAFVADRPRFRGIGLFVSHSK